MTHTNLSVPRDRNLRADLRINTLQAELEFWKKQAEYLQSEIENIPLAIEKYGYLDINHDDGKLTLVAKPEELPDV